MTSKSFYFLIFKLIFDDFKVMLISTRFYFNIFNIFVIDINK